MSTRNRAIVGYGSQAEVGSGARSGRGRRRAEEEDDDDNEEATGQATGGPSGRRRAAAASGDIGLSSTELEALVSTTMRYVIAHQTKTIARVEVLKFLTEDHRVSKGAFAAIMTGVENRLEETMGYRMVELANNSFMLYNPFTLAEIGMEDAVSGNDDDDDDQEEEAGNLTFQANSAARRRQRRAALMNGSAGSLRIRIQAEADDEDEADEDEDEEEEEEEEENEELSHEELLEHMRKGLLLITLANLYMNEEPMAEEELLECLELAGVNTEVKISEGDVEEKLTAKKMVLEELRIANYLKRTKVTSDEPAVPSYHTLSWGLRAWIEFSPTDVVAFVRGVYQKVAGHDGGPEEELRWERMSRRLAKDERARAELLRRGGGQEAFEKLIGQKRHDLDDAGGSRGQLMMSGRGGGGSGGSGRQRGRPRATQNGHDRDDEEDEEEEEEEQDYQINDSYREQLRRRSSPRTSGGGPSSRPKKPYVRLCRGFNPRGPGRKSTARPASAEPVDVKPKRGRGRAKTSKGGRRGGNVTTEISRIETDGEEEEEEVEVEEEEAQPKRRGRPKKK